MEKKVELNRPDVSLANRIKAMFEADSEVAMDYIDADDENCAKLILNVTNAEKAAALRKLFPRRYNISLPLEIEINDSIPMSGDVIKAAFKGNPHFKDYCEFTNALTLETYHLCIFKEEVIKFLNDNAGSLHGYEFRLMEDLAKEVFDIPKLLFTTDDGLPYTPDEDSTSN